MKAWYCRSMNAATWVSITGALLGLASCGPPRKDSVSPVPSGGVAPATSRASSTTSGPGVTTPPSGLPPFASVPPPGVVGSRRARKKELPGLDTCVPSRLPSRDVGTEVARLAEACAQAAPMKPVGAAFRGAQADGEPAARHKVHVEGGRCYRVYLAHDAPSAVVGMRDGAGDLVAESPTFAAPASSVACFASADDVEITVSVGSGKASYAAQLVSDQP